jgi:glyoxylase-like metal-dependent hydrolase (beta-lactamase superfamily II)
MGPRLAAGWLFVALTALAPGGAAAQAPAADVARFAGAPRWRLFAVEYARSSGVPERRLVAGAAPDARVDMSWYFFVAVGHGRVVLIDCGTDALSRPDRDALRARWSVTHAIGVVEALARVGLEPAQVTDVILTHHHWDHVGGLVHLAEATVHAHRAEWRRLPAWLRRAVPRDRLRLLSGAPRALGPGLSVHEAGRHTAHHLMVELGCASGAVVIAGDAAYLRRNVEERRPVAVTASEARNVADVARAVEAVGADRVLPGHDPALFARHPSGVEGVAAICR